MPKVSFYLRNEDVEKWKAIKKKTGWVHAQLNDKIFFMNGCDPITVLDMSDQTLEPLPKTVEVKGFPGIPDGTKVNIIEKPLDKTDYHPAPGVWTLPPAQNRYELCKHDAVLGMCKKGCK